MTNEIESMGSGPVAFISSFYKEAEYEKEQYGECPLRTLRRNLHALNDDESLKQELPDGQKGMLTWVAEYAESGLKEDPPNPDRLLVVDHLVEVLRNSELYVCILADHRTGDSDHGSAISTSAGPTAVSYLEIELYAAAMYGRKPVFYVLERVSSR